MGLSLFKSVAVVISVVAASAGGCSSDASPDLPLPPCQACACVVTDPNPHCLHLEGCADNRDCPHGTECSVSSSLTSLSLPDPLRGCVNSYTSLGTRCELARAGFPDALIAGFLVNEFALSYVEGTSPVAFSWKAPDEARFVVCALFGCRPEFSYSVEDDASSIINWERCVLSSHEPSVFESSNQAFVPAARDPADVRISFTSASRVCSMEPHVATTSLMKLTELGVGCWAYDDVKVIAATRILPIPVADAASYPQLIATCDNLQPGEALSRWDDWSCFIKGTEPPTLGTCLGGECRARCITAQDCPSVAQGGASQKDCPEPRATCLRSHENDYVGICDKTCDRDDLLK